MPPEAIIDSIKYPCICHFKDINFADDVLGHFYAVIPIPNSVNLTICIFTSQIEKRIEYYRRVNTKAIQSLLKLDSSRLTFLSKECVIDCNKAELLPKALFKRRIDPQHGFLIKAVSIESSLLAEIINAIKNSPVVAPAIKKLL